MSNLNTENLGNSKKIASLTLGCKVNLYDTEAIVKTFTDNGYECVDFNEFADVYLINTCTVTNFGDKKSRQMIRKAKKINKNGIVVACGCYAQVSPDELSKIEDISIISGTKDRLKIYDLVCEYTEEKGLINNVSDIMHESEFENLYLDKSSTHTRAYLKIQEGCDRFCTYCIIPFARGPVRSRKLFDIISEVNSLVLNGYKEVVLAGIHVASYAKDFKYLDENGEKLGLLEVIKEIHKIDGIERIRLSSIEPSIISDEFVLELAKLEKVCNHFHLSLQSGCDKTLSEMNRKYNSNEFENAVKILRKHIKNVAIATDIIVGFPNETNDDFNESFTFANKMNFSKIHVFPYSPKKGTKAAIFANQIESKIKEERSKKMIALSEKLEFSYANSFLNSSVLVLFETIIAINENEKYLVGHTSNYIYVKCLVTAENIENIENYINCIKSVKIVDIINNEAYAKLQN